MEPIEQLEDDKKEQGKSSEIQNALQKLIKLDKKNSTFDFVDDLHRIKLKIKAGTNQVPLASIKNEHILRGYWRHASGFYFKKIEESQFARLDYLRTMLNSKIEDPKRLYYDWKTNLAINQAINLNRQFSTRPQQLQQENLLKHLLIAFTYANAFQIGDKKFLNRMRQFNKERETLIPKLKNNKNYQADLQKEQRRLDQILSLIEPEEDDGQDDEISRELGEKLQELEQLNLQNKRRLKDLSTKAQIQVKNNALLYFVNTPEDAKLQNYADPKVLKATLDRISSLNRVEVEIKFLRTLILKLDQKQVAETISKVVACEKVRGSNVYKYTVAFEESQNLNPESFTEEELKKMNNLREDSLFKFYNLSIKSAYTHISHVISGFGYLYKKRTQQNAIKNKDLLEMMRKAKESHEAIKEFQQFEICHHCKQLYHNDYLVGCSYKSSKQGIPVISPSFADPYTQQVAYNDATCNITRSFANRKRNGYMCYTKRGNQYVCLRKYCKPCLKLYDNLNKNGMCPFCQGICYCTRCLRAQYMNKLRTIYSQAGGDVNELHEASFIQRLMSKTGNQDIGQSSSLEQDQPPSLTSRKGLRRKGRQKKVSTYRPKSNIKTFNYMKELRQQMEQSRLICDMVKRRQKQKLKVIDRKFEWFRKKLDVLHENVPILKKYVADKDLTAEMSFQTYFDQNEELSGDLFKRKLRKNNQVPT